MKQEKLLYRQVKKKLNSQSLQDLEQCRVFLFEQCFIIAIEFFFQLSGILFFQLEIILILAHPS